MRVLVLMENPQASFNILRLDTAFRLSHLCIEISPCITRHAAIDYDAFLAEWALVSIIAGDGAAVAGLPTLEELAHDPTVCQNKVYLGNEVRRQAHLLIAEGGLGVTKSIPFKDVDYIGCATPWSWDTS